MKKIKNILMLMSAALAVSSCVEKEPDYVNFPTKDVDFTFAVEGDEYSTDFYYVSPIKFTNTSAKSGAVAWDFDGDGVVDSTEPNPVYKFAKSGKYNVTLTIENVGSRSYPVQVMDIVPVLSIVAQSDSLVEVNKSVVELGIELPNPEEKECSYVWKFEEGTTTEDGTPITTFEGENPGKLKFKNIGTNKITLETRFDVAEGGENRPLESSFVNIQVASTVEAPTLYYASYGGNIKAYKLLADSDLPEGSLNKPYDMGVSSGVTPQSIVFAATETGDFVYILDCGKKFTFQNDTDGTLGDGKITVMSADGTYVNTVITNVGGFAFSDPFHGCLNKEKDKLLYTDRNNGVSSVALTSRGEVEKRIQSDVNSFNVVNNSTLAFYNKGIGYGAVSSGIYMDKNGVYYWPKSFGGNGIYRFRQSDIGVKGDIPCPILLSTVNPKAFAIDETRKHMYVWHISGTVGEGFSQYPLVDFGSSLAVSEYTKFVKMDATETAGSAEEALYVSQFAIDDATGNVYFGFNPDTTGETTRTTSGIYYYDYAAGNVTAAPLKGTEGEKAFGICVNPRKTKLF